MQYDVSSLEEYFESIPNERTESVKKLYTIIKENLPAGFEERINYGHIGFVVPHSLYPKGYHCDAASPLPFIGIASQKNFIALYHMAIYADPELYNWFTREYPNYCKRKLDMGKSCIRFKKIEDIPYELIKKLVTKITPQQWIELYENSFNLQKK